jgi:hypothetical protein
VAEHIIFIYRPPLLLGDLSRQLVNLFYVEEALHEFDFALAPELVIADLIVGIPELLLYVFKVIFSNEFRRRAIKLQRSLHQLDLRLSFFHFKVHENVFDVVQHFRCF